MRELFIRADATSTIGTGHVMRTLALSQEWLAEGGNVTYISFIDNTGIKNRIEKEGCNIIQLDAHPPGQNDLERALSIITSSTKKAKENELAKPWILLDGYNFYKDYQIKLKEECNLLIIDDYNHLKEYFGHVLLNQNITAMSYKYTCDKMTQMLLGTKYALLRREFTRFENNTFENKPSKIRILITLGGADPDAVILKVIKTLNLIDNCQFQAKIIIGPANRNRKLVENMISNVSFSAKIYGQVKDMARLMSWADIAISGGGSTCLELMYMGVPCCCVILAKNQLSIVQNIEKMGAGINLGWYNEYDAKIASKQIIDLIEDKPRIDQISNRCTNLIDGKGTLRVAYALHCFDLPLREVKKDDVEIYWNWANDETVRKFSLSSERITWDEHKSWFAEKIDDKNSYMFLALSPGLIPIGQIRFDIKNNEAEIDVSIVKKKRGLGIGKAIIKAGIKKFLSLRPEAYLAAHIKSDNRASIEAFMGAGFMKKSETTKMGQKCFTVEYV